MTEPTQNRRHSIVNKETLVPAGIVAGLLFLTFQFAQQWTMQQLHVEQHTEQIKKLESRVLLQEDAMIFWRREVEKKLGPLPDYKPTADDDKDKRLSVRVADKRKPMDF